MATLKDCMLALEARHGGPGKAAKRYSISKTRWKTIRDYPVLVEQLVDLIGLHEVSPGSFEALSPTGRRQASARALLMQNCQDQMNTLRRSNGEKVATGERLADMVYSDGGLSKLELRIAAGDEGALGDINADLARVMPGKRVEFGKVPPDILRLNGWYEVVVELNVGHLVACTEDEMLAHLAQFKGRGVADPNYRDTKFFANQWRLAGGWYYWKKGNSKIEAVMHQGKKLYAAAIR